MPNYYVFRIDCREPYPFRDIRKELIAGRYRQGWGDSGCDLKANTAQTFPHGTSRYKILSLMLDIKPGDRIIIPKVRFDNETPSTNFFTIAICTAQYRFAPLSKYNDYGHIIEVDVEGSWIRYNEPRDSIEKAAKYIVNMICNFHYGKFDVSNEKVDDNPLEMKFKEAVEYLIAPDKNPAPQNYPYIQPYIRNSNSNTQPAVVPVAQPADNSDAQPADNSDAQPADNSDAQPVDNSDAQPADNSDAQPADNSDAQPVNNSDAQSADNSDTQPVNNSDAQPADNSDAQPADNSDAQPVDNSDTQPVNNSDAQPVDNSDEQPVDNSDTQSADNSDAQPVDNSDAQPVDNSDAQPEKEDITLENLIENNLEQQREFWREVLNILQTLRPDDVLKAVRSVCAEIQQEIVIELFEMDSYGFERDDNYLVFKRGTIEDTIYEMNGVDAPKIYVLLEKSSVSHAEVLAQLEQCDAVNTRVFIALVEDFSDDIKASARQKRIMLINGRQFAELIIKYASKFDS